METQLSARELALLVLFVSLGITGINLIPATRSFNNKFPFQEVYGLLGYMSNFTLPGSVIFVVVSLLYNGPVLWWLEVLLLMGLSLFLVIESGKDTPSARIS